MNIVLGRNAIFFKFSSVTFVVLLGMAIGSTDGKADYCSFAYCKKGTTHVACKAEKKFGPSCESATEIKFDTTLQQIVLDRHNLKRSQVATGNLPKFPTASNMLTMVSKPNANKEQFEYICTSSLEMGPRTG